MDANFHIFLLNVLSVVIALVVGYSLGKSDAMMNKIVFKDRK